MCWALRGSDWWGWGDVGHGGDGWELCNNAHTRVRLRGDCWNPQELFEEVRRSREEVGVLGGSLFASGEWDVPEVCTLEARRVANMYEREIDWVSR